MRNILVRVASRIRYSPIFDPDPSRFNTAAVRFQEQLSNVFTNVFIVLIGCAVAGLGIALMPDISLNTPLSQLTLGFLIFAPASLGLMYSGIRIMGSTGGFALLALPVFIWLWPTLHRIDWTDLQVRLALLFRPLLTIWGI